MAFSLAAKKLIYLRNMFKVGDIVKIKKEHCNHIWYVNINMRVLVIEEIVTIVLYNGHNDVLPTEWLYRESTLRKNKMKYVY